ncbi:MAG: S8 family serine peptidase [Sedimentisphaerales bacterium]|nr:S8 family serine peptidase [Sedimentisphaerales bacterium]
MRSVRPSQRIISRYSIGFMVAALVAGVGISMASNDASLPKAESPAKQQARARRALQQTFVTGQVIVKLRDGQRRGLAAAAETDQSALFRLQAQYGVEHVEPVRQDAGRPNGRQTLSATGSMRRPARLDLTRWHLFRTERDVRTVCAELRRDAGVEYAQPNYVYHTCAVPNDPKFPDQYAHQLIQMPDAWDISTGSRDVVVAVLDTGVDVNHPDLKDNIWTNLNEIPDNDIDDDENGYVDDIQGWNFESDNNQLIPGGWYEIEGHGTWVSGVIAGLGNNGEGVCGVNWRCSIMPLRMSLELTSDEVAEGLDYATANGADILNMSFGADEFGPEGDPIVKEAIDNAFAQGVLLVASAGNSNTDRALYPAAHYNVMAVSSTNGEDIKTEHSMFGPWVDIAAPGTDIVTTDFDGEYIYTAGTSFSAPYVAAVGALLLSHRPDLTHTEIRAILENTTDPVYYGQVDPDQCYVGTGRVNAYTALLNADVRLPLGEIVAPEQTEVFPRDTNSVDVVLFVHGDSYRLEYSSYGNNDWTLISEGDGPTDPNGLIRVPFAVPGPCVYDLRLSVTSAGYTHTDRKLFSVGTGAAQEHWPKPTEVDLLTAEEFYGGALCMDVDGDGRNEIIQSSVSWETYWGEARVNVWREDGTPLSGWPVSMPEAYDPPLCAVGDVDGDGDYEIVGTCSYDDLVYAWHAENGELLDGDWPAEVGDYYYGEIAGTPMLADLDGDGDSEIIVGMDSSSASSKDSLYALQGDGSALWSRRYSTVGPMSVADFDQDGDIEIALCGYGPGMSSMYTYILDHQGQQVKRWRGGSTRGTAVTDLDGDGQLEMVFCTEDSVQAVRVNGTTVWTTRMGDSFDNGGAMTVGDIDSDGKSEVYISNYAESDGFSYTLVYALDGQGRQLTDLGFPKAIVGNPYFGALLIGDIDGDGDKELLATLAGRPTMAWERDGSTTPGFPMFNLPCEVHCAPALEDLDQDGDVELLTAGYDYRFHVVDLPGQYDAGLIDWGALRHDPQCSGSTAMGPALDPIAAPNQVTPGQRVEFALHPSGSGDEPVRLMAGNLPAGAHFDSEALAVSWKPTADQVFQTFTFSFLVTDGIRQASRSVSIEVAPDAIYHATMDTDPLWQLDEGWAWGAPSGAGSGSNDPASGYTGQSVIGYALEGDYTNNLAQTRYATTGPIDCRGCENIRLSFWRWLGIESPYDYACIQVSNDGVNWVDLWTVGYSHISESAWQFMEYAVPSSIADGQATVYFRWGLGPTDDTVVYGGWNIDDVQVTGDPIE